MVVVSGGQRRFRTPRWRLAPDIGVEVTGRIRGGRWEAGLGWAGEVPDQGVIAWSAVDQVALLDAEQLAGAGPAEHGECRSALRLGSLGRHGGTTRSSATRRRPR